MTSSTDISWDSLRAMLTPDTLPVVQKIADRLAKVINEENRDYEQLASAGPDSSSSVLDIGRGVGTVRLSGKSVRLAIYSRNFQDSEWWVLSVWGLDVMSKAAPRSRFQTVTASIGKDTTSTNAITVAKNIGTAANVDKKLAQKEMIERFMQFALGEDKTSPAAVHTVISLPPLDHCSDVTLSDWAGRPTSRRAVFSLFTFDFAEESIRVHLDGSYYVDLTKLAAKYQKRASSFKYVSDLQRHSSNGEQGAGAEIVCVFDEEVREENYKFDPKIRPIEANVTAGLDLNWLLAKFGVKDEQSLLKLT